MTTVMFTKSPTQANAVEEVHSKLRNYVREHGYSNLSALDCYNSRKDCFVDSRDIVSIPHRAVVVVPYTNGDCSIYSFGSLRTYFDSEGAHIGPDYSVRHDISMASCEFTSLIMACEE